MQGNLGSDGTLSAVYNWRWNQSLVTKTNAQIMPGATQGLMQIDNDYTGKDFSASLKAFNPSFLEGGLTGIFVGSYLQSVTPGLALGFEAIWQRQGLNARPETALSYCAKYKGDDWIGTAQLQAQGTFAATYWRKLSERVEAGVDMNLQFAQRCCYDDGWSQPRGYHCHWCQVRFPCFFLPRPGRQRWQGQLSVGEAHCHANLFDLCW